MQPKGKLPILPLASEGDIQYPSEHRWERILTRTVYSMAMARQSCLLYRLPSVREFVKLTGASFITITRVFNELDALGLIVRKHGSGYFPKEEPGATHLLKLVRPRRLAFILSFLKEETNYLRYDLFFFIQKRLAEVHGSSEFCLKSDILTRKKLPDYDGFFVFSANEELIGRLKGHPTVCVGNYAQLQTDYVGTNLADGSDYVAESIRKEKRKHLSVLISEGTDRILGLQMAELIESRLANDNVEIKVFSGDKNKAYQDLKTWLRERRRASTVLTMHCDRTGSAIRACENLNLRIGTDVRLIAWGSANLSLRSLCDFTILRSDRERMADDLLRLLLLRMLSPRAPLRSVELPILRNENPDF